MWSNEVQGKFIKNTLYVVVGILLLGFVLLQPYNLFCKIMKNCTPITFSSFSSHKNGINKMTINFVAQIPKDLENVVEFKTKTANLDILNGKKILNSYLARNLSKENITVGAHFDLKPDGIGKYLERVECICFGTTPLNSGEEKPMPINFRINPDIEKDLEFKDVKDITVSYRVYLID
ncbi:MAG: cytochrome c oxidase assembly protein subunit 11 [Myxococcota bacterium]|jgi:cytochrome c oxidase assembly protein subunit 11